MSSTKKFIILLTIAALVVGLALLAGAAISTRLVMAAGQTFGRFSPIASPSSEDPLFESAALLDEVAPVEFPPFPDWQPDRLEYLAQALGISVEELKAAYTKAREKALDQAVEQGLLTEKQAEFLKKRGGFFPGRKHHGFLFRAASIDFNALLAEALNISVEELRQAQEKAFDMALNEAIEKGYLTSEEAQLMKARRALQPYLDREALLAQALGMSVEQLRSAREEGKSLDDLIKEKGLTYAQMRQALLEAAKAAVQQAVADGVITQAQADQIISCLGCCPGFAPGFGPRPGGPRGPRGFQGPPPLPPEEAPPEGDDL